MGNACPHPQPAKTGRQHRPHIGDRREVQAVARVVLQVGQVDLGGLAQVIERQVELADLGGHDRLAACRQ